MSGVSYGYFNKDYILANVNVNMKVMFGCGIGVGFLLIIGVFVYLSSTTFFINWILTVPVFIIVSCLYITYTRSGLVSEYLNQYNFIWNPTDKKIIEFQWKHSCCGYENFTDRSIPNCPYSYQSGCRDVIGDYLRPRFYEIFVASITMMILFVVSMISLSITSLWDRTAKLVRYIPILEGLEDFLFFYI